MDLGQAIRTERHQRGLSMGELARTSGVAASTVQRIESGAISPTTTTANRLLAPLGKKLVVADRRPSDALQDNLQAVIDELEAHGATDIRVFGSVARGTDTPASDIDILCHLPRPMGFDFFALCDRLTDLLGFPVDIVSDTGTGSVLDRARAEAIPL